MSVQKSSHTSKLSLNVQHDYMTLRTPNGNLTVGRSGYKASGSVDAVSFNKLVKFVSTGTLGKKMEQLLNPTVLSKYFPQWDNVVTVSFKKGDKVTVNHPSVVKAYGTSKGVVEKINTKNVVVRFPKGCLSVPMSLVTK